MSGRAAILIDGAPRFALVEADDSRVRQRLAAAGWTPTLSAPSLGALDADVATTCEVVVVVCSARTLLSPVVQADAMRIGATVPLVAVVTSPGVGHAADAARLGWRGFASATSATAVVARTIHAAARGELAFPSSATSILARALAHFAPFSATNAGAAELTPRQREIVSLIAKGATDAEIATELRISQSTAHKHVQNARRRLKARTRSQLVAASRDLPITAGSALGLGE
jgi:DNA-binding NarL/FixJ family response regulator